MRKPKSRRPHNDLSRSLTPLNLNHTLIVVIELSQKSWVVAGLIPGVERRPLKKFESREDALLSLIDRWRKEAEKAGHKIERIDCSSMLWSTSLTNSSSGPNFP